MLDRRPPAWLYATLVVLNLVLFLPVFLTAAGHVDVLPFTPKEHPRGPFTFNAVSAVEYVKALLLRRPNLDVFRVSLEFVATNRLTLPDGRVAGERLLARPAAGRPDALFGANDLVALGLLQAITGTRSLRVPDDIALIGYDDIDFAAGAAVPLTSIAQPRFELGRLAMDLLLKEADDPSRPFERIVLQPELVARASTAPAPGNISLEEI
jgi:DNA-binding LacI/PurR family transcriptional regulator